ncbi:hypothetical protein ACFQ5M_09810 [Agrilactobacillus yilanensis]|uniref:Mur ligase central domain-containing protein n=1 Tax=Agrilactobacillus yilanensis TaxID=2485997 RepID=A0ABW4J9S7_9LACO|nr:hypothetical protein [Agrilactobacillus yilanensis]
MTAVQTQWHLPQMIQIGSTGRNSGKTMVARALIQRFKGTQPIYALKVITITGQRGQCQRGGVGCGICTSIDDGFELIEETNTLGAKDTMMLLQAGSTKVFLLKAFEDHLLDGFKAFVDQVPADGLIICESNSLREYIQPGLFIMMDNQKRRQKPTAAAVYQKADLILSDVDDPQLAQVAFHQTARQAPQVFLT